MNICIASELDGNAILDLLNKDFNVVVNERKLKVIPYRKDAREYYCHVIFPDRRIVNCIKDYLEEQGIIFKMELPKNSICGKLGMIAFLVEFLADEIGGAFCECEGRFTVEDRRQ